MRASNGGKSRAYPSFGSRSFCWMTGPAPNRPPRGAGKALTTPQNAAYVFAPTDFGFSDPDDSPPNNFKAVEITTLPDAGTLTDNGAAVSAGQFVSISDINSGLLVFTAANASGTPRTSFTFQVQDDGGTDNDGVDTDPYPKTMTIILQQDVERTRSLK